MRLDRTDLKERYSVSELLSDLEGCQARSDLLFVEQSYSGILARKLPSSRKHRNLALLSGTSESWGALRPGQCVIEHLHKVSSLPRYWSPLALLNMTLAGAPCSIIPSLTELELRKEYMGCQNLPTTVWNQNTHRSDEKHD
ncbi:hypothetical protein AOXY_G13986 [Acipenser oxyrinchus oxyrinchus]|uniref:Uncharacterized protein n=1 Tax=Acipenser oxyrinchus oxyrinchus TaxID=40147 RepID=A0AAD8D874_ACIOX|nr:hypothetical protein AOXY_G13986 [Acipenser oxyrinchus oxyrinchus]